MTTERRILNCKICGGTLPKGRLAYCSDDCNIAGVAIREKARQDKRRQMCVTCGKPKSAGVQGTRYCDPCREAAADATAVYQRQKNRFRVAERRAAERVERQARQRERVPEGHKWCNLCDEARPLQVFTQSKAGKYAAYCKPCTTAYHHERRLRTVWGLSFAEYGTLMQSQDDRCAICLKRPRAKRLAVDHNHKTGEIRGLLCGRCNKHLLGAACESPELLRRAADYLETPPARLALKVGSDDGRVIPTTRITTREVALYLANNGFPHAEPAVGDLIAGIPGLTIRVREDGLGLADEHAAEWLAREPGLMVVRSHKADVDRWRCWFALADLASLFRAPLRAGVRESTPASMHLRDVVQMLRAAGHGDPMPVEVGA